MSNLFALMTNDDSLTPLVLKDAEPAIEALCEGECGLGLGWLQEGRSLLRKYPATSAQEVSALKALEALPARALMACASAEQPESHSTQLLPPFRFRKWLYAQHGQGVQTPHLEDWKAQLPEFLRINASGDSDAEVNLFALLHSLHAHDVYHHPTHQAHRRAVAVHSMLAKMRALEPGAASDFGFVCMTEGYLLAYHEQAPMFYRTWRGVDEPAPEPLFSGQRTRGQHHGHLKAAMIVSATEAPGPEWTMLEAGHVLWMDKSWAVQIQAPEP